MLWGIMATVSVSQGIAGQVCEGFHGESLEMPAACSGGRTAPSPSFLLPACSALLLLP